MPKILLSIYGLILFLGAYFGAKAGSKVSIISGLISGTLVFIGVYLTANQPHVGYRLLAGLSGTLCVVFLIRVIKTQQFVPSGVLLTVSGIALAVSLSQVLVK